jgi:hypothetical protein
LLAQTQLADLNGESDQRWQRLSRLFLGLGFYLALFGLCSGAIASADTWWHLATGRWIVQHHAVPHNDPFSFATSGKLWVAHEYLTDVLMFYIHRLGGFIALAVANAFLLTLTFTVAAHAASSSRLVSYLSALLAAFAARPAFALRPQSISLAFGAVFLWILRESLRHHDPRWLVALPCMMVLWVQLHAGYLLGIGLIGLVFIAEIADALVKRTDSTPKEWLALAAAGVACIAVVPLNPNGFTMLTFPFYVMRMKINRTILEWRPANLHDPHLYPFIALALVTLLAMLSSRNRYRPGQFLIYALLLGAALRSARNLSVFCLVAVVLLADHLRIPVVTSERFYVRPAVRTAVSALVLIAASYLCAQVASTGLAFQATAEKTNYPRVAISYLSDHHLPANVLNDYTFGGYMIWCLYPDYKVYVDGRADLYGDDFLAKYVEIYNGESDPAPFLDQNSINTVVIAPGTGLATIMRMLTVRSDWRLEYEDNHAVIFVRSHPRKG